MKVQCEVCGEEVLVEKVYDGAIVVCPKCRSHGRVVSIDSCMCVKWMNLKDNRRDWNIKRLSDAKRLLNDIVDNVEPFINALETRDQFNGMDLEVWYDKVCKFLGRDNPYEESN